MANTVLDRFEDDIRKYVLKTLPRDSSDDAELQAMDTTSLLVTYINWARRFPTVRPRRILESAEIIANPERTSAEYGPRYIELVDKIRRGDDLSDRLSRRVGTGYKTPTPGKYNKNREDLDLLLNDWEIHHLHFDPAGMKMLLFAQFLGDTAYLINIYDHNSWTKREIAEIIIDNWPTSSFVREIPEVSMVTPNRSDSERAALRNNGIAAPFFDHKGKTYMIGTAGVTSAGTSTFATLQGQWLMKTLAQWDAAIANDPEFIRNKIRDAGVEPKDTINLEFVFMNNQHFGIGERNSGVLFRLTQGLE